MNRRFVYPILIILVTVGLYYLERYVDKRNEVYPEMSEERSSSENTTSEFGVDMKPSSTTGVVVDHVYYSLSYSEEHEQAEWVAYELKKSHLSRNDFERPDFVEDRDVATKSADWRNFRGSGYDRGHLCPAGDRRFSYEAYHETFLTSNISPQNREFNGGIWNRLEQKVRYWAGGKDGVYVVTGGVLKRGLRSVGYENVSVPDAFYKIVVDRSGGEYKAIAFLIPNEPSNESFYNYVTTIDAIESKTGIDFFPELPDSEENKLESSINLKDWGKR